MIIGVDLGNYAVKTSTKVRFSSKVSESNGFSQSNEISINGRKIIVGEGEFDTNYQKSKKQNTLSLLYSALALSSKTEQVFDVMLGLPIQQYKKNKQELISLVGNNRVANVGLGEAKREIIISEVEVAPECASSYYSLSDDIRREIGKMQLTIVDIGGGTSDICLFQDKKIIEYTTLPVGMLNIYSDIINALNEEYTQKLNLEDAEDILSNGLFLYGKKQDISFCKNIIKNHFDKIFKDLQLRFNIDRGYVLLTGGGSIAMQQPFKNRLNNIIIADDPVFSNALGFKKVGEKLWQQRLV